tara:strand:- start:381 stop:1043 length:663 start_codon:yes stop_codon:yes gene_type:complete
MKLIPAIDLKNNKVVISTKGKNREYKPIPADLSPTSDPIEFIEYILSLNDFNTIYLADLDSIANFKVNNDIIENILLEHSNINFMVDNGVRLFSEINQYKNSNFIQVVATETFVEYSKITNNNYNNYILSADFVNGKLYSKNCGYKTIKPNKVIAMDIDNIGKKSGANINNVKKIKKIYPYSSIILSGGIGSNDDIMTAKANKISEIMLLTALLEDNITY